MNPIGGATLKRESQSPQVEQPHRGVGVHHNSSRGHIDQWESKTTIQGATPKRLSPSPNLKGPNSRGHGKVWLSITSTGQATPKCGIA